MTGLSGSGKTTLALALEARLLEHQRLAYRLDGDVLRKGLSSDLGLAPADRTEHLRRVAHVAALFADAGHIAIVAAISPLSAHRAFAREVHRAARLPFAEVFVDAPLEVCRERDPKGLYARSALGDLVGLTGVDAPYQAPVAPELRVATAETSLDAATRALFELALDLASTVAPEPA